MILSLQDVS